MDKRKGKVNNREIWKTESRKCYKREMAEQNQEVKRIIHRLYYLQVIWAKYRELQTASCKSDCICKSSVYRFLNKKWHMKFYTITNNFEILTELIH